MAVHVRVVIALLRREMTTRYGASFGGYFWAVAEPVGMIALMSLVFSMLARAPMLGQNFIVFFASGYLAFNFYKTSADLLGSAIKSNLALIRYPNVTIYDALVARLALQFLTNCMVSGLILGGAIYITGEPVQIDFGYILPAIFAATLLAAGAGSVNAVLFVLFPLWERVFAIISRPLFIISAVFYTPESMPAMARDLLAYNPLVHIVGVFRQGVYPVYHATVNNLGYPIVLGLVLVFLGLLLLRRFDERLADL